MSLSLAVANEILSDPEAPGVRVLCKILTMMDLTGCAQSTVKEMKILTARMLEVWQKGIKRPLHTCIDLNRRKILAVSTQLKQLRKESLKKFSRALFS